jgi:hypothetical protein
MSASTKRIGAGDAGRSLKFRRRPDEPSDRTNDPISIEGRGALSQVRKREHVPTREVDVAARGRAAGTTRLRALRLAKEAEDAAEKQAALNIKAAGKAAFRRRSTMA